MVPRRWVGPRKPALLIIAALLLGTLSCVPRPLALGLENHEERIVAQLTAVSVGIASASGRIGGAGVVLKHRKGDHLEVLSAAHVYLGILMANIGAGDCIQNNCALLLMTHENGEPVLLKVQKIDFTQDLVLFHSLEPMLSSGPTASFSQTDPPKGAWVWVVGSPSGLQGTVTKGIVSNHIVWVKALPDKTLKPGLSWIDVDAQVWYGNSGGGVFNLQGELVGTVLFKLASGGGRALSYKHLKDFVAVE